MKMFQDKRIAFFSNLALNLSPLFMVGALLMTTDTPLGLFWFIAIYCYYSALFENRISSWYWGGLFFGLGMLSKYTMALLAPCLVLFMILSPDHRIG